MVTPNGNALQENIGVKAFIRFKDVSMSLTVWHSAGAQHKSKRD